ncbi:MAG: hypothetical protein Q8M58_04895, partial [Anaerolineales bacterium]|nr:hypothetical protein [Anaerolineales bacterium]
ATRNDKLLPHSMSQHSSLFSGFENGWVGDRQTENKFPFYWQTLLPHFLVLKMGEAGGGGESYPFFC